ncbi:MAG: NUDIX hydrolase [Holosporaceae bacterium]|jgi:8-oxo-dGTP diphosphatase|nr:NUDIX hydrolase [Holosporaceae bacterium]
MKLLQLSREDFKEKYKEEKIEKVVVGAVVCDDEGNVLLLRRASGEFMEGLVELPSGNVELDDKDIGYALEREIKEETGLDMKSVKSFIGSFDYKSSSGKNTRQLNYLASTTDMNIKLSAEHDAFFLVPFNELSKYNISASTNDILRKAFAIIADPTIEDV